MNRKASAMGLTNTHFANPTGLQDEANYSTCRDMAAILSYAMRMSLCRRILTTDSYNATCTKTTGRDARVQLYLLCFQQVSDASVAGRQGQARLADHDGGQNRLRGQQFRVLPGKLRGRRGRTRVHMRDLAGDRKRWLPYVHPGSRFAVQRLRELTAAFTDPYFEMPCTKKQEASAWEVSCFFGLGQYHSSSE